MAEQVLKTIFQLKRGQSTAWASANPVLRVGEPGYEIDTGKLKIGDGVKPWNTLRYLTDDEKDQIQNLESLINELQGIVGYESDKTGLFGLIDQKADKNNVYSKEEIDKKITGIYTYKGSVIDYSDLPTEGLQVGDVYNIEQSSLHYGIVAGDNVAWDGKSWDKLGGVIDTSLFVTKEELQEVKDDLLYELVKQSSSFKKFVISGTPEGTLIKEKEGEIRIMIPKDAQYTKQSVGANGNPNMFYIQFRAYAPSNAVSFKEGDHGVIVDEMHSFNNNSFAGVDELGRKYSVIWLAVSTYNAQTDSWTYFGANSKASKYIGWDYVVEWYDANGKIIETDGIRINLSNEECHEVAEPYYMAQTVKEFSFNGSLLDKIENRIAISMPEFEMNENGDIELAYVNVNKLVQSDGDVLIFDGGAVN